MRIVLAITGIPMNYNSPKAYIEGDPCICYVDGTLRVRGFELPDLNKAIPESEFQDFLRYLSACMKRLKAVDDLPESMEQYWRGREKFEVGADATKTFRGGT
jgi:hypothetical protein